MTELVQIVLPDEIVRCARDLAQQTGQRLEDLLQDWIVEVVENLPVDSLPDNQLLELCEAVMPDFEEAELHKLLKQQRESILDNAGRARLEELVAIHQRRLVRKGQALQVAVQRGLIFPLR